MEEEVSDCQKYLSLRSKLLTQLFTLSHDYPEDDKSAVRLFVGQICEVLPMDGPITEQDLEKIIPIFAWDKTVKTETLHMFAKEVYELQKLSMRAYETMSTERYQTYPTVKGQVITPAIVKFKKSVAEDLQKYRGTSVFERDIPRGFLCLGQNLAEDYNQIKSNTVKKFFMIQREVDKIIGIAPELVESQYQLVQQTTDNLTKYTEGENKRILNNLIEDACRLVTEPFVIASNKIMNEVESLFQKIDLPADHELRTNFKQLLQARKDFVEQHPDENILKMFLQHCSAQYIVNSMMQHEVIGDIDPNYPLPPSIMTQDFKAVAPMGASICNMTRMSRVEVRALHNEQDYEQMIAQAAGGTYLLAKNVELDEKESEKQWQLIYKPSKGAPKNIDIKKVEGLETFLKQLKEEAVEQLTADQQHDLRMLLGHYHEQLETNDGDLVITIEQEVKQINVYGGASYILGDNLELEKVEQYISKEEQKDLDPMFTNTVEMRVTSDKGELNIEVLYQKIEVHTPSLIHTPQEVKAQPEQEREQKYAPEQQFNK